MNDVDRYLVREYTDTEYRRYQIAQDLSLRPGWLARLWRAFAAWRPKAPVPLPSGETSMGSEVRVWLVGPEGHNVHCVKGVLWLTKTGDNRDYILSAGQNRHLEAGHWVVQALVPARFRVYRVATEEVSHGQASLLPAL